MGSGENSLKTVSSGAPSSASTIARAASVSKGGIWCCSLASSTHASGGNTSGRVASAWPALTKAGPSRMKVSRILFARICTGAASPPAWW